MKRKFLILTLCFTIIFSSLNYKKSYANPLSLAPEIMATIGAIAIGTGITVQNNDDIVDISRLVYDSYKGQKEDIEKIFFATVSLGTNGVVKVGKEFLDICKNAFDKTLTNPTDSNPGVSGYLSSKYIDGLPYYDKVSNLNINNIYGFPISADSIIGGNTSYSYGSNLVFERYSSKNITALYKGVNLGSMQLVGTTFIPYLSHYNGQLMLHCLIDERGTTIHSRWHKVLNIDNSDTFDLTYKGSYSWDNIDSKTDEQGNVGVYVPGNVGSLPGQVGGTIYDGVFNPPYGLTDGTVSIPSIDNPSIPIGDSISIPGGSVVDTPTDTPTDTPDWLPTFPSFGDELDFSPLYVTNIKDKFPFSLPWDFKRVIDIFDVEPIAPRFEVPLVTETIEIDFSYFEEWATIIRFFITIIFTSTLIFISTKLKG